MLRDIASEVYTAMQDTALGAPDTHAATPDPAGPDCLVGYVADALDHAGRISASIWSTKAAQSSAVCSRHDADEPPGRTVWRAAVANHFWIETMA
jgi:hypothetical protein